jgi:hypothetical protein
MAFIFWFNEGVARLCSRRTTLCVSTGSECGRWRRNDNRIVHLIRTYRIGFGKGRRQSLKLLTAEGIEVGKRRDRLEAHEPVLIRGIARGQYNFIYTINVA